MRFLMTLLKWCYQTSMTPPTSLTHRWVKHQFHLVFLTTDPGDIDLLGVKCLFTL